ncbi:hypothetical protein SteCoe_300 [Stentor coeruleus]|uniref:Ankyrin repeat protein n=1 Tax=Stentor coeruleus TaxID=5963 RepID=A0A1R2D4F8_9CILI|nr:hypothetical protein SteCoe_300 [Stentor coeruleus]
MGCCEYKNKLEDQFNIKLIFECIRLKHLKVLKRMLSSNQFNKNKNYFLQKLNNERSDYKNLSLNTLSYALILGDIKIFILLHKAGCSLSSMESILLEQGLSSLNIICMKGYSNLLSYYIAFCMSENESYYNTKIFYKRILENDFNPFPGRNFTPIQLATIFDYIQVITVTPIQLATIFDYIQVITVINEYVKNLNKIPEIMDLDYIENITGMNCPLLAVKYGNFAMVKYLHKNYNCNFHLKDTNGLGAVEIAVNESSENINKPYGMIIVYLIDVVGVKYDGVLSDTVNKIIDPKLKAYLMLKLSKHEDTNIFSHSLNNINEYVKASSTNESYAFDDKTEIQMISGSSVIEFIC